MNQNEYYMMQAVLEGRKALPHSSPNPNVGAVVVKNNRIVGRGYTQIPSQAHAEVMAIKNAGKQAHGASLYVTLEACSHFGRTPPCTDFIIANKLKEVFIGMKDPNPLVCGSGIQKLRSHNVKVQENILKDKIIQELQWYIKYVKHKLPYITLKSGMSLDGKITDYAQNSQWITSEQARKYSQRLREVNDGMIVGINTIVKDNPFLTYRGNNKKKQFFYRIILDTNLDINIKANILRPVKNHYTIIATGQKLSIKKDRKIRDLTRTENVNLIGCPLKEGKIDLKYLLQKLAKKQITKLIVEGGSEAYSSFLQEGLVDKIILLIAPKLLGGQLSKNLFEGKGVQLRDSIPIQQGKFYHDRIDNFIFEGYTHVYRHN